METATWVLAGFTIVLAMVAIISGIATFMQISQNKKTTMLNIYIEKAKIHNNLFIMYQQKSIDIAIHFKKNDKMPKDIKITSNYSSKQIENLLPNSSAFEKKANKHKSKFNWYTKKINKIMGIEDSRNNPKEETNNEAK